jgi:16S rRNA (uracil1498-N3)-methyltransferase
MRIEPPLDWLTLLFRTDLPARRWLGHRGGDVPPTQPAPLDTLIAVGPEGGFTVEEVSAAVQHDWSLLDLGPRILRIETAALVLATLACH